MTPLKNIPPSEIIGSVLAVLAIFACLILGMAL